MNLSDRTLTFNELMIIGAIKGNHLNPFKPETWDKYPDFYRGLARIAKTIMIAQNGLTKDGQAEFDFWENCDDVKKCKEKVQEAITLLQSKKILAVAQ